VIPAVEREAMIEAVRSGRRAWREYARAELRTSHGFLVTSNGDLLERLTVQMFVRSSSGTLSVLN
jgi:hypothetical protein